MFCSKCGTRALDGAEFCQKCGTRLIADAPAEQPTVSRTGPVQAAASAKKKSKLPITIGAVAAAVIIVLFIVLNWEGKVDYEANVRAYKPFDKSQGLPYSCGEVFDKYIPDAKWNVRESGDKGYVDITGTAKGTDKTLVVTIEMSVDSNDFASIVPVQIAVDGEKTSKQNEVDTIFLSFFAAYDEKLEDLSDFDIFVSEVESALQGNVSSSELPSDTPAAADQLLLCGIPVDDIMGARPDDIIAAFGEPATQTGYTLEYGIDEWEGFTEDGWMCFYLDDAGKVNEVDADAANFTFDDLNLATDYDALALLFDRDFENLGGTAYIWQTEWTYGDYHVRFTTPRESETGLPSSVQVMLSPVSEGPIDDYTYFEDDSTYSTNLDSSLVGRWRAYDGGSVEFSEYGGAAVSFSPHGSLLFPDYMTWEAYDGRIILSSHFSDTSTWQLSDYYGSTQLLSLSTKSVDTRYTRSESSTSLVGTWDKIGNGYKSEGALVLYSDGTGTMEKVTSSVTFNSEHVPISWWSDDTNLYINWTLLSAYDYTVSGDTLTIFFSNGSRVYTKVGG